jgi:acyl-CoA synthetase (AMP-forming)/AMP-acid ligase II
MTRAYNLGALLRLPADGDLPAIIDLRDDGRPQRFTAAGFDALCSAVARGLARRGVRPGTRVGILSENRVEFLACYFGTMRLGAVTVPVNHKLPAPTVAHVFRDSAIEFAFADGARRALVPAAVPTVEFDAEGSGGFDAFLDPGPFIPVRPPDGALAEILYTSGSTGLPKGVPLPHAGQLWAIEHYLDALPLVNPQDTTIVVAPLYHMNGLFFISVALANRTTVVMLPHFDARRFLETVDRFRCTLLSGIPTMFALMVRERDLAQRLDLRSVREISIGSAPLTDALLAQVERLFPNALVKNGFGTTEAGPAVFGPHPDGRPRPPLALGHPYADIECRLVDGPSPDQGILMLRTPAVTPGYLNLPEATAAKFRDGWYLTGDVMRRDAAGFYYFLGRADDMFVCGGENVYPGEVEKLLERHPAIAQAVVVAAPDDIKGAIPVAFVVPRSGFDPTTDEVKQFALATGPAYAHPRLVVFVEHLPVAGTHKIDRTSLTVEAARLARAAGRSV